MQIKNYHIIRSLERNTLSELFLARHVHEDYTVKIRVYDTGAIANEEVREAILQRLRNAYQMRHRNIIATLDYGVEERYMYQIQEHMDYGTLESLLAKVVHIPPEIAAFILQEILRALQYAHSVGVFHGMLNPARVLLSSNGLVKVDDFQFLDLKNTFLKQIQSRMKAQQQMYLAPEHLLGKEADHRCDLFSAGVLAYKMLTGKHPFLDEKSEWTVMQIIACSPKLIFEMNPTLPSEIEALTERMIEKELGTRTQTAEEALRILDSYTDRFGDIRSYDVLANFLKKPQVSVEQLNQLRTEELLQQAAQLQLQEQWDRALIACQRARFLKPKDKNIEQEIRALSQRMGYGTPDGEESKLLQLEQSLKANPDNIQILQRLGTFAKSRGDLLQCAVYHKRILKLHPKDVFSSVQLRQLLENPDRDALMSPNEMKWTRWQEFSRARRAPSWMQAGILNGNGSLVLAVLAFACLIGIFRFFHLLPEADLANATPATVESDPSLPLIAGQKMDAICDQAALLHQQGAVSQAVEMLTKAPMLDRGPAAARARILLARYLLETETVEQALGVLEDIDLPTANRDQKIEVFRLKAEVYRKMKKYGRAIDQYINIEALRGITPAQRRDTDSMIEALQNESFGN